MDEPFENVYFNWLCAKVVDTTDDPRSGLYWNLLRLLQQTEFVWRVMGDDNRAEDGKELRSEFILEADIPDRPEWRNIVGCSVLEMLIAFARRAEFQTDIPVKDWFWMFITNLELHLFDDRNWDPEFADDILQQFIWRTYSSSGHGGLFPIMEPLLDQREVEIWYQFSEYVLEQGISP